MDERDLRGLLRQVKAGRMSRRGFVRRMTAVGLTAPMATQLLALSGVAMAQPNSTYKPTKAGGGGPLKILLWQAPTLLNPHFAIGTKDQAPRASSSSRWPAGTRTATSSPASPPRFRPANGSLAADGMSVIWKLKQGVKWHDGKPFTADDVVFTWAYAADLATAADSTGSYKDITVEKIDDHTVKVLFTTDPVLGRPLRRLGRPDPAEAPFRRLCRREVARGAGQSQAGRHRPVQIRRVQAGRPDPGRTQPRLSRQEPAAFRHARGQGRRRRGLRGAHRAPDRRVRLCLEPAGGGGGPQAHGGQRQGQGRHPPSGNVEFIILNTTDPWTEVDGERSSVKTKHPTLSDPVVRQAFDLLIDREAIQKYIYGRGGIATASFVNQPQQFKSGKN